MKRFSLALAASLLLVGAGCAQTPPPKPAPPSKPVAKPAPTPLVDATFTVDGTPVAMKNGISVVAGAPGASGTVITRFFGLPKVTDLNGDGTNDAVVILSRQSGGSGTFYYAAAALDSASGYAGTDAILLGDRIAPQGIDVRGGVIEVNYAERKPGEPMTAKPSVGVTKYLRVVDGQLTEVPKP